MRYWERVVEVEEAPERAAGGRERVKGMGVEGVRERRRR